MHCNAAAHLYTFIHCLHLFCTALHCLRAFAQPHLLAQHATYENISLFQMDRANKSTNLPNALPKGTCSDKSRFCLILSQCLTPCHVAPLVSTNPEILKKKPLYQVFHLYQESSWLKCLVLQGTGDLWRRLPVLLNGPWGNLFALS